MHRAFSLHVKSDLYDMLCCDMNTISHAVLRCCERALTWYVMMQCVSGQLLQGLCETKVLSTDDCTLFANEAEVTFTHALLYPSATSDVCKPSLSKPSALLNSSPAKAKTCAGACQSASQPMSNVHQ